MGNAQVSRVDEPRLLLTEYGDLAYQDVLGSYKLFKVMRCVHEREGNVLVKLFIQRDGAPDLKDVKHRILQVKEAFRSQWLHPNVVPYQGMEITAQSAILLRPHFACDLYDRMHTRPFLSELMKNWIAFQVLCSVCQAHSMGVVHGDLKTENVFVSSWNHAVLSDFAGFKPLRLPEDDPSIFSFFFESDLNRRRCYLAPERFDTTSGRAGSQIMREPFSRELAAMDVFSLGCVLAELFLDGQTLMDLPELLRYRSGQLDLHAKLSGVKGRAAQELLGSMLHRDPAQRRPAIMYLREWCARVVPRSFCGCLFPLSVLMLHPMYQQPDMRVALIRHNFANILWCLVGPSRISKVLGLADDPQADGGQAPAAIPVWRAWLRHVETHVRSTDEAMLHGMVHAAAQAASQWAEAPAGDYAADAAAAVDQDDGAASGQSARQQGSTSSGASKQAANSQSSSASTAGQPHLAPRLSHPWLREFACDSFTKALIDHWEEGCKRCIASGRVGAGGIEASPVYASFLADLCSHSPDWQAGEEVELPGPGAQPGAGEDEDVLSIVCGIVCSCLQHLSHPRMRIICLDMFEQIAPFTSQHTVLEQIVPYCHLLMTDPAARVRARAICVLTRALGRVEELPPGDTPLFMEYLFPQLMSAMSGMGGEPVVLLAIAGNIGALAQHAARFAELSVAAAQRGAGDEAVSARDGAPEQPSPKRSADAAVEVETFDVQCKHLREAVKRIVKALLECLPAGPQQQQQQQQQAAERSGLGADVSEGLAGVHEESLLNLAAGREVKIALLRNMCVLADSFGRDDTHNFLLPYLISFMNDPAWEVRAAFCEEAALLPKKVGQVSTEGIIWPCYEQALLDQEERVLRAALTGLKTLTSQRVLRRQSLVTVASKVAPLLVHPSAAIRRCSVDVFSALGEQLSAVDQYVFVMPAVRPLLKLEVSSLEAITAAFLVTPLGRRTFKRALLRREEELHEALLHKKPLPRPAPDPPADTADEEAAAPGCAAGNKEGEDHNWDALELLRPYMHLLLRSRPTIAQMSGAGPSFGDERGACVAPSALVQSLQYSAVNPHCAPNRSLQARALSDFDSSCEWLQAAVQGAKPHPLGLFSAQAFLAQALCLPPRARDLGSLNCLDGTPYSLYAATSSDANVDLRSQSRSDFLPGPDSVLGLRDSIMKQVSAKDLDLGESLDPSIDAAVMTAAAMTSSERRQRAVDESFQSLGAEVERRSGSHHAPWRPQGVLLATLYEYAHQSGVPVAKVDTTDDSRALITGGKDGVVKIWNCAQLERDVAVSSSHTLAAPSGDARRRRRLRALRTVRNAKAVAVGTEAGEVFLYKIDPSRGSATTTQVCHFAAADPAGSCAVMCIEQFDTELESLVVFAQQHGAVQGWDIRSRSPCWSGLTVSPSLGVPSCMALASDSHALVVGTLGGGLVLQDLRFLAPWRQWRVSSGAAVLALRAANFRPSPGVFAALGGDSNEVALFDVTRGSCLTLFLTDPAADRQKEAAISVPTLLQVQPQVAAAPVDIQGTTSDSTSGGWHSAGCVRSLWLPPRGAQTFLLAGGTDRKVRHWSLDPEHHAAEAYIVTPPDPSGSASRLRDRVTYSSNHLGDVFVVQEQPLPKGPSQAKGPGSGSLAGEPEDGRPRGPNPNHRDAILDMCSISLQRDILVTAGRDGLVKLWK